MKLLLTIIVIALLPNCLFSQVYSNITYDAGTQIEVQTGADVCANDIIISGSFSGGGTLCTGPLPVTLSEFIYSLNKNNVLLKWKTEAEVNNSGFDIERKPAGQHSIWEKIGFVPGNGTTNEQKRYAYEDKSLQTGKYLYRLKQIDYNGNHEYFELFSEVTIGNPAGFSIEQNSPNPFNPVTNIKFSIPQPGFVTLKIYDMTGQEVAAPINGNMEAGYYNIEFNASHLSSGVYLYRLSAGNFTEIKKMILVK